MLPDLTCRKLGQDQPRVIILTNYDGLESPPDATYPTFVEIVRTVPEKKIFEMF